MKRFLFALSALITLTLSLPALAQYKEWGQIPIPPLPAFKPQQPKRIVLPNGMVIFLQEDHELPLIDGVARIRGGSTSEPAAKSGLVDLYGEVCQVSFFGFLRPEVKFEGLDALVAQMKRDEAEARALLAGVRPLSELDSAIAF